MKLQESVYELVMNAKTRGGSKNAYISNLEVKQTFGKGSETPGSDEISSKLIDKADRKLMHLCLKTLWNKAWSDVYFITEWKQ